MNKAPRLLARRYVEFKSSLLLGPRALRGTQLHSFSWRRPRRV